MKIRIDKRDLHLLRKYKYAKGTNGYCLRYVRREGPKTIQERLHRDILGCPEGQYIDHINGDTKDNRRSNLRVCSAHENGMNKKISSRNRSGYKGVYWHKTSSKWIALIQVDKKRKHIGSYSEARDAAMAYNEAAKIHYGEFARLNEIA